MSISSRISIFLSKTRHSATTARLPHSSGITYARTWNILRVFQSQQRFNYSEEARTWHLLILNMRVVLGMVKINIVVDEHSGVVDDCASVLVAVVLRGLGSVRFPRGWEWSSKAMIREIYGQFLFWAEIVVEKFWEACVCICLPACESDVAMVCEVTTHWSW